MAKTRTVAPPGPPRRRAYSGATAAASTPGAETTIVAGTPSFRAASPTAWQLRESRRLMKGPELTPEARRGSGRTTSPPKSSPTIAVH
eukprot:jgi/Chrpa1/20611/Chrysochromulina_OHIO_Genome00021773-RA